MNRKHTIEEYLKIYEKLKNINSNIEFSSDFIIGYPEESDDDFKYTMKLIEKVGFINSYSFIFSARPGTPSANLKEIDAVVENIFAKSKFTELSSTLTVTFETDSTVETFFMIVLAQPPHFKFCI